MIKIKKGLTNIHFQDPATNDNPQSTNLGLSLVIWLKCLLQATFSLIMCKMVTFTSGFSQHLAPSRRNASGQRLSGHSGIVV